MARVAELPKELGGVEDLIRRFKKAQGIKDTGWREHMRQCYQYAIPQRETFNLYQPGQKKNVELYDDTAVEGVQEFASRLQTTLMPPWRRWTKLVPGADIPDEQHEAIQPLLDDATEILFTYLDHSNLATQAHEAFQDLAVSTGLLTLDEGEGDNLLQFNAIPLAEAFLEDGPNGSIGAMWRLHKPKRRNVMQMWPSAEWSEEFKKLASEKPDDDCEILEGVIHAPKQRRHYYVVIERESGKADSDDGRLAYAEEERTARWIAFREAVVPGETYGRGRIMRLLPTIKTANKLVELILRNAAISVSGMYTAISDGVINPYNLVMAPGVIPVASNDRNNPSIRAIERSADFQVGDLVLKDLQDKIRKGLLADPFGSIEETPVRTATEMAIRNNELLQRAGSAFGRLQTELVERVIARAVEILQRNGKIPPISVDGREVTLKHMSPLARAQDDEDLLQFQRFMETAAPLGIEALAQSIKIEEAPRFLAEKTGIPAELIRTEAETGELVDKVAQMLAQMQFQAQQAAQQKEGGSNG